MANRRTVFSRFASLVVLLVTFTVGTSVAQLFPDRISGTVRDAQGAVVPGATVKLSNPTTGQERTVTTDDTGKFNFPELALGTFRLAVSQEGFGATVVTDVTTSEGLVNNINPVLAVGSVGSRIEVTSTPPLIQTETDSCGGQLSQEQVESLPLDLLTILPRSVCGSKQMARSRTQYPVWRCIDAASVPILEYWR